MINNIVRRHTRFRQILHESQNVHGRDSIQGQVQDHKEGQENLKQPSQSLLKALEATGPVDALGSETQKGLAIYHS